MGPALACLKRVARVPPPGEGIRQAIAGNGLRTAAEEETELDAQGQNSKLVLSSWLLKQPPSYTVGQHGSAWSRAFASHPARSNTAAATELGGHLLSPSLIAPVALRRQDDAVPTIRTMEASSFDSVLPTPTPPSCQLDSAALLPCFQFNAPCCSWFKL